MIPKTLNHYSTEKAFQVFALAPEIFQPSLDIQGCEI